MNIFLVLVYLALGSVISLSVGNPDGRLRTGVLAPQFYLAVSGSLQIRWGWVGWGFLREVMASEGCREGVGEREVGVFSGSLMGNSPHPHTHTNN